MRCRGRSIGLGAIDAPLIARAIPSIVLSVQWGGIGDALGQAYKAGGRYSIKASLESHSTVLRGPSTVDFDYVRSASAAIITGTVSA